MWPQVQRTIMRVLGAACVMIAFAGCRVTRERETMHPVQPSLGAQPARRLPADEFIAGEPARMIAEDQKRAEEALEHERASKGEHRAGYRDRPLRPPPRR